MHPRAQCTASIADFRVKASTGAYGSGCNGRRPEARTTRAFRISDPFFVAAFFSLWREPCQRSHALALLHSGARMKPRLTTLKPRVQVQPQRLATLVPGSWRTSSMSSAARGYDYRWQKRREAQLREHPLCCYCERKGRIVLATVADHVTPHRGDPALFDGPLQSLCATCHSSAKQREEAGGG